MKMLLQTHTIKLLTKIQYFKISKMAKIENSEGDYFEIHQYIF